MVSSIDLELALSPRWTLVFDIQERERDVSALYGDEDCNGISDKYWRYMRVF